MAFRKFGSSQDQNVTETDTDEREESTQGIHRAAVQTGAQEPTPQERRDIIDGEGN
jgi:hypothetical protein